MSKLLLHALARGLWAIDPNYAQSQLVNIEQLMRDGDFNFKLEDYVNSQKLPYIIAGGETLFLANDTWYGQRQLEKNLPAGSTIVIPVSGAMMKADNCYSPGTSTLSRWNNIIARNQNIATVIYSADSPGGQVDGTQTFGDSIINLKKTGKKTIGFVNDGTAASACYWILSQCDEVVSSHATNQIGSIGVFVQLANWEKHYAEQHKLEIISIYSDHSSEKNLPFIEALKKNEKLIKQEMLNPIALSFISAVKSGRSGKLNLSAGDPFKGKLYMSEEAKEIGLIDRIASLDEIIGELSSGGSGKSSSKTSASIANPHTTMKKLSIPAALVNLLSFFSATAEAGKDKVEVEASEEKFNEILKKADSNLGLDAKVTQLTSELEASQKVVGERDATITALNEQITKLKGSAGSGPHSVVKTDADPDPNAGDEDLMDFEKEAIAANKAAQAARKA